MRIILIGGTGTIGMTIPEEMERRTDGRLYCLEGLSHICCLRHTTKRLKWSYGTRSAFEREGRTMQKITPFLWFDGKAEEAMNFYVSI